MMNKLYKFNQVKKNPKGVYDDVIEKQGIYQNPWHNGVYQQQIDEPCTIEESPPQTHLRRSTRVCKPNFKYANTAIIEEESEKEPETFEEASDSFEWIKVMKE